MTAGASPARGVSRRRVLAALAGAAGGCLLPSCGRPPGKLEIFLLELVDLVAVPDPFAVGASYLRAKDGRLDADLLVADVFPELTVTRTWRELRDRLSDRVRLDFEHGRTAEVDGWLLSRSEARLCALLALDR